MRKRIYEIIEYEGNCQKGGAVSRLSAVYDFFMMLVIVVSIVPLAFKQNYPVFVWIEYVTAGIFVLDYLLRL